MSVNRKGHTSEAELRARIEAKIARDMQDGKRSDGFYKVVTARCGEIRSLIGEDGRRLFCVYDTANLRDRSHADGCQAEDPPPGTQDRRSIRNAIGSRLFDVFATQAIDLATVYAADD